MKTATRFPKQFPLLVLLLILHTHYLFAGYARPQQNPTAAPSLLTSQDTVKINISSCNGTGIFPLTLYNTGDVALNFTVKHVSTFTEDFENGLGKWTTTGYWGISTDAWAGGASLDENPSGDYFDNMDQTITLKDSLLVQNPDSCILSFWMKRSMECCCDYFTPQFSLNNGEWVSLNGYNCSADWAQETFNLSSLVNTGDYIRIRFVFTSDYSVYALGVNLDNLSLGGISESAGWMSSAPEAGTIPPGDSTVVYLSINAQGLNEGSYYSTLLINSNDPLNPEFSLPVVLTLTGLPQINANSVNLVFPPTMVNASSDASFQLSNTGCSTLWVDTVYVTEVQFSFDYIPDFLLPGQSVAITVSFNPGIVGMVYGDLVIVSIDSTFMLPLEGEGTPPPIISLSPDEINLSITSCSEFVETTLTVYNNGGSELTGTIGIDYTSAQVPPPLCQPQTMNPCTDEGIIRVVLNTIDNSSTDGCDGYQNFDYISTTLKQDETYFLAVTTASSAENVRVWIDYNADGIFNMDNELIMSTYNGSYHTINFSMPWNVKPGIPMRMRVMSDDYYWPEILPCNDVQFGQAEDYTIFCEGIPDFYPNYFAIAPGDFAQITLSFDASQMMSGQYNGLIIANSNDPVNPFLSTPFHVNLDGAPLLYLSTTAIDFGEIFESASATNTITIGNQGCDSLLVSGILSNQAEYTVSPSSFFLLPWEYMDVSVTFTSDIPGTYMAILEVQNNDNTMVIDLSGTVIGAPQIDVNPDSLNVSIASCGDSLSVPVTIYNAGSDTLYCHLNQASNWVQDFEEGINGWYTANYGYNDLWHLSQINSHSYSHALWCGIENQGNYSTGSRINNAIISPPIDLRYASDNINFSFWETYNTEGGYDRCMVDVSVDDGISWTHLRGTGPTGYSGGWIMPSYDLSAYAGNIIRIRFYFDTQDGISNTYSGWFVDDINITNAGQGHSWLSLSQDSVMILPGDSAVVNFTLHSQDLPSGIHSQIINITSNAPLTPSILFPVSMNISGLSIPSITKNQFNFPTIMQHTAAIDSLHVVNTGCDTLFVQSIGSGIPDFYALPEAFYVLPFDSVKVDILFSPEDTGAYATNLNLNTDNGSFSIAVAGWASGAPVMGVGTDTINISISGCNDTINVPFTISNPGLISLDWHAGVSTSSVDNMALLFNSNDDYVYLGNWTAGTHWTLEAWVKPSSVPAGRKTIIGGVSSCADWAIVMQDGKFGIGIKPPGSCSQSILAPFTAIPENWYHVAATNDGTTAKLYVNGVLMNQGAVEPNYSGFNNLYMSYEYCCYYASFPGTIDEVRVWNTTRDAFMINNLMHHTIPTTQAGMIARYAMDEGSGTLVHDGSGYGHNGSMSAASWVNSDAPIDNFVQVSPADGILMPGNSTNLNLQVIAGTLPSGTYEANLVLYSNDPMHQTLTIPIHITLDGNPKIEVSEPGLAFGTILQYTSKSDTFSIRNTGCDTLFISDLLPSSSAFVVGASSLSIFPFSEESFVVSFQPMAIGTYTDTLKIFNNDVLTTLYLSGVASPIPHIVTSEILYDTLICAVEGTKNLVIKNTGVIPLSYTIPEPTAPWLHITPSVGLLLSGDSAVHQLTYSKEGLDAGEYSGTILINSNDPLNNPATVQMSLNVLNAYQPVHLGPDRKLCDGSTAVINAGSGYASYLWNDGSSNNSLTISAPGTYIVLVSDSYNCSFTDTLLATYFPYPAVNAGNDTTICEGTNFIFNPQFQNLLPTAPTTIQVGSGASFTSSVGPSPFGTYYMDDRTQMLYTSSELATLGLTPGGLTAIAFKVGSIGSPGMQGLTIRMGLSLQNTLSGFVAGLSTVYTAAFYVPVTGWNEFVLTEPFYWDGIQNIVVEVCFNNNSYISNSSVQYSSVPNTVWSAWCDNCAPGCNLGGGSAFSERANLRISGSGDISLYTWTGPNSYLSQLKNARIDNASFSNAGTYSILVDNGVGCTATANIIIAVNPSPVANAGPDATVVYGTPSSLNASGSGGILPYTFSWTPTTGLDNPNIANPTANPPTTTQYTLRVTAQNQCSDEDALLLTILPIYQIDGSITYKNASSSPLNDISIFLKAPGGAVIDTSVTNNNGAYHFDQLTNNTFTYSILSTKAWGGVNATDALQVARHIVYLISLDGLYLQAADVNNSGSLSSVDPLLIMRRSVGAITSFPAGDWIFENTPINVLNSNVIKNIKGVCVGDVNGSHFPGSKVYPAVTLKEQGSMTIPSDGILEIPIRIEAKHQLGAITLGFTLSEDISEVLDVSMARGTPEWNLNEGNLLRIAWHSLQGLELDAGDTVLRLKLRLKEGLIPHQSLLSLTGDCEIADVNANVLTSVSLMVPKTSNSMTGNDLSLEALPNPFNKEVMLAYSLPGDGQLRLTLYDVYGRKIRQLYSGNAAAGAYKMPVSGEELPAGLYYVELRHEAGKSLYSKTISIVKTHIR